MTGKNTKKSYKAPALEKGLQIIELLASVKEPLSMGEIATRLNYSKNEIFRMLVVLEDKGYIARKTDTDLFAITQKLFSLGIQIQPATSLIETALPEMRQVADDLRQSCHMAVLNRAELVVISRVESPAAIGYSVRAGHSVPAHLTASGMLLMAFESKSRQRLLLDIIKKEHDPKIDSVFVLEQLAQIHEQHYFMATSHFHEFITDITVPLTKGDIETTGGLAPKVLASMTVPFVHNHNQHRNQPLTKELVLERLQQASKIINAQSVNSTLP